MLAGAQDDPLSTHIEPRVVRTKSGDGRLNQVMCAENQSGRGANDKKGVNRLIGQDELRPALRAIAAAARAVALVRSGGAPVLVDEAVQALATQHRSGARRGRRLRRGEGQGKSGVASVC